MNPEFQAIMAKQLASLRVRLMDMAAHAPATWGPVEAGWLITHIADETDESCSVRGDQRRLFCEELENNLQPMPF